MPTYFCVSIVVHAAKAESLAGALARRDRGLALVARQLRLDRGDLGRVAVGPRTRRLEVLLGLTLAAACEGQGGGGVGELEPVLLETQPLQLGVSQAARDHPDGLAPSDRRLSLLELAPGPLSPRLQGAAAQRPQRARGFVQLLAPAACLLARRGGLDRPGDQPQGDAHRRELAHGPRRAPGHDRKSARVPGGAAKKTQVAPQPATGVPERPGVEDLRARREGQVEAVGHVATGDETDRVGVTDGQARECAELPCGIPRAVRGLGPAARELVQLGGEPAPADRVRDLREVAPQGRRRAAERARLALDRAPKLLPGNRLERPEDRLARAGDIEMGATEAQPRAFAVER